MPSRRMIDPAFWESATIASFDYFQRLLFVGLFSQADDQGRLKAHPALLRSRIFPYDDIPLQQITDALEAFQDADSITVYNVGSTLYLQILNWWKYQKPQWAWPSEIPAPDGWEDRLHYREGNDPVYRNWPDHEDTPEPESPDDEIPAEEERGQSGATVEPQRGQSGTSAGPGPSNRCSTRVRSSTRGNEEGADAPPPEPPATRRKAKSKEPPAVAKYREATNLNPVKTLYEDLDRLIGDDPDDLDRWYRTCKAWVAMGWNRMNVKGMAEHYVQGRIPGDDQRARASPGQLSAADAVRQWVEEEGIQWQQTDA